jgi:hypothetical protein
MRNFHMGKMNGTYAIFLTWDNGDVKNSINFCVLLQVNGCITVPLRDGIFFTRARL